MKNILTNKIILIILTIFAVIMGFGSSVFASFDFSYNDSNVSLPDLPSSLSNFIITKTDNLYNVCFFSNVDSLYIRSSDNRSYLYTSEDISIDFCSYTLSGNTWSVHNSFRTLTCGANTEVYGLGLNSSDHFQYSTFDLKKLNGEVVFQGAPQVQEETTILAPIVEQAETERTMAEILGILPLIVALLVSIIAIRKAISFLGNVLRAS